MKTTPFLLAVGSAALLCSCATTYDDYDHDDDDDDSPYARAPRIVERQAVVVERPGYIEDRGPVVVEQYPQQTYRTTRPYYGDPVPDRVYPPAGSTYQRTTTRTYQGY